ncbi:MAG TPA: sodium:proton antiporter NhaD [Candidatus Avibacteroides faecavium]|nr:sodium:proton antiporter NhaD [Candidatus Avibacteroides faecavium]
MFMITAAIVGTFLIGYAFIAMESTTKINKAAIALLMCVTCWVLYMLGAQDFLNLMHPSEFGAALSEMGDATISSLVSSFVADNVLIPHLGSTSETIFFLLGAMTVVEVVDSNGGFNFVKSWLRTRSKRKLLWAVVFLTFFLSAVLDNLTTSLVMIAILRKLVPEHKDRIIYAAMVILAANAGGAFSPIGDVTTIMLWINGSVTSLGVIEELFLPSLISIVVPTLALSLSLKGQLGSGDGKEADEPVYLFSKVERNLLFIIGVGGLIFVPVFRHLTGLPPFMGVLLVLSLLWIVTEIHYMKIPGAPSSLHRVSELLRKVDFSTLLFFLGILMTVASLEEIGVLHSFGEWLDTASGGNSFIVTGIIGLVSAIVDNVPLVASCMGMYEVAGPAAAGTELAHFMVDGSFWQLLAFCAGTGGSILIIGSAAGVAVMGLEKISFGWYLKHVSWLALLGYFAGMVVYWLQLEFIFG